MKSIFFYILLTTVLFFGGCATTKSAYTDRNQLMLLSESQEVSLGEQARDEVLKSERLSANQKYIQLTKKVGNAIAKASGRDDFAWEFYVIQKEEVNAFCLPGGKVFVNEGLFTMATTEGELATVVAHEVGHAVARHGAERMSMQQGASLLGNVLSAVISAAAPEYSNLFNTAYGAGVNYGVILPYSRKMEYEADYIGVLLMKKAGYDPNEALKFWKKMAAQSKKGNLEYLSTHPSDANRIAAIEQILQEN